MKCKASINRNKNLTPLLAVPVDLRKFSIRAACVFCFNGGSYSFEVKLLA